jgi:hypothetical protein
LPHGDTAADEFAGGRYGSAHRLTFDRMH